MDKLVRRVTRIERSGQHREATVLYNNDEGEEEGDETPHFSRLRTKRPAYAEGADDRSTEGL